MTGEPAVAVAVVSWNTRDLLERCLRSLEPEAEAGSAEVWVVDNGSTDGSAALVRDGFGWARLLESDENLGFGEAVNRVAARTATAFLAPANADVELEAGALGELLAAAERDATAGALAPRLVLPDGATQHSVHRFPTLPFVTAFNLGLHRLSGELGDRMLVEGHWDPERERRVDWAHGAFLLVRRSAWDAAGGFDPEQWMYAEDLDLCWRLADHGYGVRFVPSARVRHRVAAAADQAWGDARTERWLAATYAWMERRRGRAAARAYAALNLLGAAARWAALRPLAALRPARWARPAAEMGRWTRLHLAALRGRLD
jgi:N-acetylglucosaminyl-diphospho-decaprenol L-rhamnosyltransferase